MRPQDTFSRGTVLASMKNVSRGRPKFYLGLSLGRTKSQIYAWHEYLIWDAYMKIRLWLQNSSCYYTVEVLIQKELI